MLPATTYHFRLAATNATGTTNGADLSFTTPAAVDSDGDGMPNDYETDNGFDPANAADAALDADGDGMTNLQEYLAGTNPRVAASVLRPTSVLRDGEDFAITFPSVLGKMYRVEAAESTAGPWMTLQDHLPGTGDPLLVSDTEAFDLHPRRVYRISVVQP